MNREKIISEFYSFEKLRKRETLITKIVIIFCFIIIIISIVFTYKSSNDALNKVLVVDKSGEYLKITAEPSEKLFRSLVSTTCQNLMNSLNTFDRLNIQTNQAKASFICNQKDIDRVSNYYQNNKVFYDVLNNGVVYSANLYSIDYLNTEKYPFHIEFTSLLQIWGGDKKEYKLFIKSSGYLVKVTPQYPENTTGLFFADYNQQIIKNND